MTEILCNKCNEPLDSQAPRPKTIKYHLSGYYPTDVRLCHACFTQEKEAAKKRRQHGRILTKNNFDGILATKDYKGFRVAIRHLNEEIISINKGIDHHLQKIKKLAKKYDQKLLVLKYAHQLTEERPELAYPEYRKTADTYIAKSETRKKVFEQYGKKCVFCGSRKDICIDHIVPVIAGGSNNIENLQPLCRSCNSRKGGASDE